MLPDALHPQGVKPRQLPAPQAHMHVIRRLHETLQVTQKEAKRLWDVTQSLPPRTDTTSPARKRQRTDTGSPGTAPTCSTPGTSPAIQHDVSDPPSGGTPPNP